MVSDCVCRPALSLGEAERWAEEQRSTYMGSLRSQDSVHAHKYIELLSSSVSVPKRSD